MIWVRVCGCVPGALAEVTACRMPSFWIWWICSHFNLFPFSVSCKLLNWSRSLIKSRLLFLLLSLFFLFPCQTAAKVVVWTYFSYVRHHRHVTSACLHFQRCWMWSLCFCDISSPIFSVAEGDHRVSVTSACSHSMKFSSVTFSAKSSSVPWSSPLLGVTKRVIFLFLLFHLSLPVILLCYICSLVMFLVTLKHITVHLRKAG